MKPRRNIAGLASSASSGGDLRIEYVDLATLKRAPRNPKEHDLGALQASLDRFGFVAPILMDDATGHLVAGHGRLDALQQRKAAGGAPPGRVRAVGDRWLVPVIRGLAFASPADAEGYLVADNQTTILGGWNEQELAALLSDLAAQGSIDGTGFDSDDLDDMLRGLGRRGEGEVEDPGAQLDQAAELQEKWGTSAGQLWELGRHRLLCGSATSEEDVARLLGAEIPFLCVTDPPYGVNYDPSWRNVEAAKGNLAYAPSRVGQVPNDDRSDWREAWQLFPGDVIYSWHPAGATSLVHAAALQDSGFKLRMQIIWAKSNFPIGRGDYHVKHEPCWYAVRDGQPARRTDDRTQTTLWEIDLDRNVEGGHSTQKPLECMARPIRNHETDSVYDPFVGSGTTLVAAEQLGVTCYAMDIAPQYVAVALERLAGMGLTPRLIEP